MVGEGLCANYGIAPASSRYDIYVAYSLEGYMTEFAHSFCVYMIRMNIDLTKPENRNPKPELEEGEFIETFTVPLKDLYAECRKLHAQGYAIDGKVGSFAEALELTSAWRV